MGQGPRAGLTELAARGRHDLSIYTENLPNLLGEIAELIGLRACRRYRPLRPAV